MNQVEEEKEVGQKEMERDQHQARLMIVGFACYRRRHTRFQNDEEDEMNKNVEEKMLSQEERRRPKHQATHV